MPRFLIVLDVDSTLIEDEVIELLADDPMIEVDLPAWCHASGNELLELRRDGADYVGRVAVTRDGRDRARPRGRGRARSASG